MDWQAKHAGFVLVSYLISAIFLCAMIGLITWHNHRLKAKLQALEKKPNDIT